MKTIHHIVLFKLKEEADGRTKAENAVLIKEKLDSLSNKIPQIRYMKTGINFTESDRAFEVALIAEFDSRQDLDIYQNHPEHLLVVEFIKNLRIESKLVDFEENE